jgi:hypothetical protein
MFINRIIAVGLLLLLFAKSVVDVDPAWDTWNYHLPFAARLWGIVTPEQYQFEDLIQARFDGFPLLANYLQGFFWFITQRVQSTNLVSYLSFIAYLGFLRTYLKIPIFLSTIALLAVPFIQINVTISYVDLFGNIATSILLLLAYLIHTKEGFLHRQSVPFWIFLSAFCAANTKLQLIPVILFAIVLAALKYIPEKLKIFKSDLRQTKKRLLVWSASVAIAFLLIFAIPIRNTITYGNPAYPVKIAIAGHTLNHREGIPNEVPIYLEQASRPHRWAFSILEVDAFDVRRPTLWTVGQGDVPLTSKSWVMGGYFGPYVGFHVFLLIGILLIAPSVKVKKSVGFILILTLLTAFLPQSHILRFYMYWIFLLITINLHLLVTEPNVKKVLHNPIPIQFSFMLFLVTTIVLTRATYIMPRFYTLESRLKDATNPVFLEQIRAQGEACLIGVQPNTFLYSSKFSSEQSYSLEAAFQAQECQSNHLVK